MPAQAISLLGLEKTSLRQQALAELRRAITTGDLPPGTHLVETELSEMLNISRGTLREAMRQLQQEGLITAGSRGRLAVRHLDSKEIQDIYAVRAALESLAARVLSSMSNREASITALRQAIREMEQVEDDGLEARIEADLNFHRTLCSLTGNETLLHSWQSLEGSIRMSIMFAGLEKAVRNMGVARHRDLVDALETGDAVKAEASIHEHMDVAAANLIL